MKEEEFFFSFIFPIFEKKRKKLKKTAFSIRFRFTQQLSLSLAFLFFFREAAARPFLESRGETE